MRLLKKKVNDLQAPQPQIVYLKIDNCFLIILIVYQKALGEIMKQTKFQKAKQKGFTLLELLVVITLLAILSVGALVAYEGVGDNAQATAAANNTSGADRAIRNFKAVTLNYPDQWDSLVTTAGAAPAFLAADTTAAFSNLALAVTAAPNDFRDVIDTRFADVGINAIQIRTVATTTANVEPNLQHNEGAAGADVAETALPALTNFAVLPTFGTAACSVNGAAMPVTKLDGATAVAAADGDRQNVINDSLENDECQLVFAFGFGHDAAHSTQGTSVAVASAPTFVSKDINPAETYGRYIALFKAGTDEDGDNNVELAELDTNFRLIGIVDTEGHPIDENIAASNPVN